MKKAIFIDLDGTLLKDDYSISHEDLLFLNAIKNEWDIILSTGNSLKNTIKIYNTLKLTTYISTSQGQLITKPLTGEKISNEIHWNAIKKHLKNHELENFLIETHSQTYIKKKKHFLTKMIKGKYQIYTNQIIKNIISLYFVTKKNAKIKIKNLNGWNWDVNGIYQITTYRPKEVSKALAMKYIKDKEKYEFIIAIGDGRNDIESIKYSDIGIAMKNSQSEVLKHADIISKFDNNNSGVSHVLKKIINKEFM